VYLGEAVSVCNHWGTYISSQNELTAEEIIVKNGTTQEQHKNKGEHYMPKANRVAPAKTVAPERRSRRKKPNARILKQVTTMLAIGRSINEIVAVTGKKRGVIERTYMKHAIKAVGSIDQRLFSKGLSMALDGNEKLLPLYLRKRAKFGETVEAAAPTFNVTVVTDGRLDEKKSK